MGSLCEKLQQQNHTGPNGQSGRLAALLIEVAFSLLRLEFPVMFFFPDVSVTIPLRSFSSALDEKIG